MASNTKSPFGGPGKYRGGNNPDEFPGKIVSPPRIMPGGIPIGPKEKPAPKAKSLHAQSQALGARITKRQAAGKNVDALTTKRKTIRGEIRQGADQANETNGQTIKRLQTAIRRGKITKNLDKVQARISKLKMKNPGNPLPTDMPTDPKRKGKPSMPRPQAISNY